MIEDKIKTQTKATFTGGQRKELGQILSAGVNLYEWRKQEMLDEMQAAPQTEAKQAAPQTEVKQKAPQTEAKQAAPQTEVKQEAPQTEVKQEAAQTEVKQEAPQTEAKQAAPQTEAKQEAAQTEVKQEAPQIPRMFASMYTEEQKAELLEIFKGGKQAFEARQKEMLEANALQTEANQALRNDGGHGQRPWP